MISDYRIIKHDLPNLRGGIKLHQVEVDPRNGKIESWYMNPAEIHYHDNEDALPAMLKQVNEMREALLNPKFESWKELVPERLSDDQMTIKNALYHADEERIFLGIYHDSDPNQIAWLNLREGSVAVRFLNRNFMKLLDVPKSKLDKRVTFSLKDETEVLRGVEEEYILKAPNTLRIIVEFNYLLRDSKCL